MLHVPDLTPLLAVLEKVSAGRIIAGVDQSETGTGVVLRIPVRSAAPGDRKDVEARRYVRSWLRDALKDLKGLRITTRCTPVDPHQVAWTPTGGRPIPVRLMLEISLDLVKEGEIDEWKRKKEKRHAAAKKSFYEELATEKSSDS